MSRYRGAVCRLCRREQLKLFLKGDRCYTDKCSMETKAYVPGQHGVSRRRSKQSEFGIQLREKQKVRRLYGVQEKQFRLTYDKAAKQRGKTGSNLLILLERRLDNIVYRMGFARSLSEARQLVKHSHITINGRKNNIPSALVKIDDVVAVRERSRNIAFIRESIESADRKGIPPWLSIDQKEFSGRVVAFPKREQITIPIQEQFIVELYSR
ncbi:MAG: 30S ribosomal protein S4 [Proteobacteria bacterium]|nr:30S ribosomal protein S4 [Pseudomonadota bacterium]